MPVIAGTNLSLAHGHNHVLTGVSLSVEPADKIGIVGRNGAGKSTLLKILAGAIKQDEGDVVIQRGSRVGYLDQNPQLDPNDTVHQAAARAFEHAHALQAQLHRVFDKMAGATEAELRSLLAEQERLEHEIDAAGGSTTDHAVGKVLHGLGFTDAQFDLEVSKLSGGQRARLALAKLLLEEPAALLLDEPTNHLDIDGREWLERFLSEDYRGAVILISHDRYLLDRVVNRIIEVEQARLIDYPGNYAAFRKLRAERREAMHRAWEKQQTEFKREEAFIRQYKAGQRAKQARGRESRLDRAKESALERPVELDTLRLTLPKPERSGDIVVAAREIDKRYPIEDKQDKVLFTDLTLRIQRGERWGIVGPNGAGKTTLVRCLLGLDDATSGQISLGAKLAVGHFEQHRDIPEPTRTVTEHIRARVKHTTEGRVLLSEQDTRNLAGAFLFSGLDQDKEVSVLSGGELARADLAALLASAKNLLVLDEPTNHLDIPAAERLEETLAREHHDPKTGVTTEQVFPGTVILISHDRALLDAICDHTIILDGQGNAEVYPGSFTEHREHLANRIQSAATRTAKPQATAAIATPPEKPQPVKKSKFSWMPLDRIEGEISQLEEELTDIDRVLADPDIWSDVDRANSLTTKRDDIRSQLDELETEWLKKSS